MAGANLSKATPAWLLYSDEALDANAAKAAIDVLDCGHESLNDILAIMALTAARLERRWAVATGTNLRMSKHPFEIQAQRGKWIMYHPLMLILRERLVWHEEGRPLGGPEYASRSITDWAYARAHHVERGFGYE